MNKTQRWLKIFGKCKNLGELDIIFNLYLINAPREEMVNLYEAESQCRNELMKKK